MEPARERTTAWLYKGLWAALVKWFRVPATPPELPHGPAEHVERLQLSRGWLDYVKFKFWVALFVVDVLLIAAWFCLIWFVPWLGILITPLALAVIVVPDVLAYIAIHLRYDSTWYVLSDRAMRLRRGIWFLRETTISYDNIQNVRVLQGPLERHFGISNVIVETAGGGGGTGKEAAMMSMHMGLLEGVSDAQGVRDRILERVQQCRGAGLGERRDRMREPVQATLASPAAVLLLEEIAEAAQKLRQQI